MRLPPGPWMAGMCSSMAWAWLGTGHAPSSTQRVWARKASLTRKATAEMTGFSSTRALTRASSLCALTIRFMLPWRYSMTSRERCRAIGLKPMVSSTWPRAWGRVVAYSMNSMPFSPRRLGMSGTASRSVPSGVIRSSSVRNSPSSGLVRPLAGRWGEYAAIAGKGLGESLGGDTEQSSSAQAARDLGDLLEARKQLLQGHIGGVGLALKGQAQRAHAMPFAVDQGHRQPADAQVDELVGGGIALLARQRHRRLEGLLRGDGVGRETAEIVLAQPVRQRRGLQAAQQHRAG